MTGSAMTGSAMTTTTPPTRERPNTAGGGSPLAGTGTLVRFSLLIKPSAHSRERVIVLTLWSLGSLVLHEHMNRLLGVDFLDTEAPPESLAPYMLPVVELFTQGLFEPGTLDRFADAFDTPDGPRKEQ